MLEFLVHKHLLMAHLAFRRDLSDPEMLMRFSRDVGSPELLRMLFVFTACDMTAVGPGTWTEWKAELVAELFDRTMQILSGVPPKFREVERVREIAGQVRVLLGEPQAPVAAAGPVGSGLPAGEDGRSDEFDSLPLHYLTATHPEQIARDLLTMRQLGPGEVIARGTYEAETDTVEYRVITRDAVGSGLFHKATGALTAKGLEILSASICTTTGGVVIDSFRVHDRDHAGTVPDFRLHEVERAIAEVLTGQTSVETLFQRNRRLRTDVLQLFREPTRVVIH